MNHENLVNIADSLTSLNYKLIIINLVVTCIAIVIVYFHSRIKKSAELKEININFSNVLEQQKILTKETGIIKQSIDKDSIIFQVKLNAYNEKSIEAINDIYIKMVELKYSAKNLSINPTEEEREKFLTVVSEFRREHEIKKIWIPIELAKHIEEIAIEIDRRCFKFHLANKRLDNAASMQQDQFDKACNIQYMFYDYISEGIEKIFEDLVNIISNAVSSEKA